MSPNSCIIWKFLSLFAHRKIIITFVATLFSVFLIVCFIAGPQYSKQWREATTVDIVDFKNANNITGFDRYIVPNIVHFIRFENPYLDFVTMVNILSVYQNHSPQKIIIHCDCFSLLGKYWDKVKNIPTLSVSYLKKPKHVFGRELSSVYHASDIARIQVLRTHGGIFLDNDVYVVKSLDKFRKFEFAIGWPHGQFLGTQVLVAHKNARFLKLWYESYRYYRRELWYYNAGELPTTDILERMPHLVHRVPRDFGIHNLVKMLYTERNPEWRTYYAIHLLIRHKPYFDSINLFNENNIRKYPMTYGEMARKIVFDNVEFVSENATMISLLNSLP